MRASDEKEKASKLKLAACQWNDKEIKRIQRHDFVFTLKDLCEPALHSPI
jgi:hypothetical protein